MQTFIRSRSLQESKSNLEKKGKRHTSYVEQLQAVEVADLDWQLGQRVIVHLITRSVADNTELKIFEVLASRKAT